MQTLDLLTITPDFVVVPSAGAPYTPSTGQTIDLSQVGFEGLTVDVAPTGNLAALTINLPVAPVDGAQVEIRNVTGNTVTALTLALGGSDTWAGIWTSGLTAGVYVSSWNGYDRIRLRYRTASASWWPN